MLRIITMLDAVTSTTTSSVVSTESADAISLQVHGNSIAGVSGSLYVEVSNDGTAWTIYRKLINNVGEIGRMLDGLVKSNIYWAFIQFITLVKGDV